MADIRGDRSEILHYDKPEFQVYARQLHLIVPDDVDCELYCLIFHPMLLSASGFIYEQYIKPVVMNSEVPYLLLDENILWHKEILARVKNVYHYTNGSVNGLKTGYTESIFLVCMGISCV